MRGRIGLVPHVEFRLESRQRLYWLVLGGLWLGVALLRLAAGGVLTAVAALVVAAAAATGFLVSRRFGVALAPHQIVVRGLRSRAIRWAEIRDVTAVDFISSRRVALHLADGSVLRTWAPLHNWAQPDPEFDAKFHTIYQWWLAARAGPAPMPPPPSSGPPSPPPDRIRDQATYASTRYVAPPSWPVRGPVQGPARAREPYPMP
ncbi:MAG: hypothetical protein GEV03_28415 [Streptosporangiales bacterium]|nr:hypothetical protein [Streptosporangiales bacterium]